MEPDFGLRARKKRQTRQLITEHAYALFAERGFERVTVAEIASAADVSEATVFNYFPTKEDLIYEDLEAYEQALLQALRDRPAGETVLAAFRKLLVEPGGLLTDPDPAAEARLVASVRIIADSPTLQARERQTIDEYTGLLAELLAEEAGTDQDDVEPRVVANALLGVQQALLRQLRSGVLAGADRARITRELHAHGAQALALLEDGLADYPSRRDQA